VALKRSDLANLALSFKEECPVGHSSIDANPAAQLKTQSWKYCTRLLVKELLEMRFSYAVRAAAPLLNNITS